MVKLTEQQTFRVDDDNKDDVPVTVFIVDAAEVGFYTLKVTSSAEMDQSLLNTVMENPRPDAVLTFIVDDNLIVHSHMQSYLLKVGEDIGMVATVKPSATSNYVRAYSYYFLPARMPISWEFPRRLWRLPFLTEVAWTSLCTTTVSMVCRELVRCLILRW
jgi:hypothetical protein